jgi:hypothetical protein
VSGGAARRKEGPMNTAGSLGMMLAWIKKLFGEPKK